MVAVLADAVGLAVRELSAGSGQDAPSAISPSMLVASIFGGIRRSVTLNAAQRRDAPVLTVEVSPDYEAVTTEMIKSAWKGEALRVCSSRRVRILLGVVHAMNAGAMCVVPPTAAATALNIAATAAFAVYTAVRAAALEPTQLIAWDELLDVGVTLIAVVRLALSDAECSCRQALTQTLFTGTAGTDPVARILAAGSDHAPLAMRIVSRGGS